MDRNLLVFLLTTALAADPPAGWVVLTDAVPNLAADVRYAGVDNFTGAQLPGYCPPGTLWLLDGAATALANVQADLATQGRGLLVYDAYRPVRGTEAMVDWAKRTEQVHLLDDGYIARRSNHNRGATVDLTVIDLKTGEPLDMGTPFDTFSDKSHTLNAEGLALENRLMLRAAMSKHGFDNYSKEWWHFTWKPAGDQLPYVDRPYCEAENHAE